MRCLIWCWEYAPFFSRGFCCWKVFQAAITQGFDNLLRPMLHHILAAPYLGVLLITSCNYLLAIHDGSLFIRFFRSWNKTWSAQWTISLQMGRHEIRRKKCHPDKIRCLVWCWEYAPFFSSNGFQATSIRDANHAGTESILFMAHPDFWFPFTVCLAPPI